MIEDAQPQEHTPEPANNALQDERTEIELNIANLKAEIKLSWHTIRLYLLGILGILAASALVAYWSSFHINELISSFSNPRSSSGWGLLFFYIIVAGIFGFGFILASVAMIISLQTKITSIKADIDIWETKKRIVRQFAEITEKPSYFNSLVRINVENLAGYYGLVKAHTDNSFKVAILICVLGFILIGIGLTAGFINIANAHIVSYIASASGVITEFISTIFFALYNRTIRQMKEYHNSLLTVQNILLSFKLAEDTKDEQEKAKIVSQMLAYLINKQDLSTSRGVNNTA